MFKTLVIIYILIILLAGIGYVKNIINLTKLDFETPYKAEIFRTVGLIPPMGAIIGYINIKDN
jgi:hypothetical protein